MYIVCFNCKGVFYFYFFTISYDAYFNTNVRIIFKILVDNTNSRNNENERITLLNIYTNKIWHKFIFSTNEKVAKNCKIKCICKINLFLKCYCIVVLTYNTYVETETVTDD